MYLRLTQGMMLSVNKWPDQCYSPGVQKAVTDHTFVMQEQEGMELICLQWKAGYTVLLKHQKDNYQYLDRPFQRPVCTQKKISNCHQKVAKKRRE